MPSHPWPGWQAADINEETKERKHPAARDSLLAVITPKPMPSTLPIVNT